MDGRKRIVMLALAACGSCTPMHPPTPARTVQLLPAPDDRRLLRALALTVPVDAPTAPAAPLPITGAAPSFTAGLASLDDRQRATDCLTAAVYYEARSEPLDGQRAVAQVVLNRVRDRAFPASVCRVVYQRSATTCQFSFACDGSMAHALEPRAWAIATAIARAALAGSVYAPVGSATHYHTTAILSWWASSLARIGTIGSHIFYRWSDRLGNALSYRQAYSGRELSQASVAAEPLGQSFDGAANDERGVMVHRGPSPSHPVAAAAAAVFGVRVHRGIDAPAADEGASVEAVAVTG